MCIPGLRIDCLMWACLHYLRTVKTVLVLLPVYGKEVLKTFLVTAFI